MANPQRTDGEFVAVIPQSSNTKTFRATANGTTNVTITLTAGVYWVIFMSADPTSFMYGSFAGAPTLPASAAGTADIQFFPAGQRELLYVDPADLTYNVKRNAAGTEDLYLIKAA